MGMNNATLWKQDAPTAVAFDKIITIDRHDNAPPPKIEKIWAFLELNGV